MTPQEAIERIAALCDQVDPANLDEQPIWPMTVRAILAEVSPEPGVTVRGPVGHDPHHERRPGSGTCDRTWTSDRLVNEPGSRAQLGPVIHICRQPAGHPGAHRCGCGQDPA